MIYPILLATGLVGLVVMALMGVVHVGGHQDHGGHHSLDVNTGHGHGALHDGGAHAVPGHAGAHGALQAPGHGAAHGHAGGHTHHPGAGHHGDAAHAPGHAHHGQGADHGPAGHQGHAGEQAHGDAGKVVPAGQVPGPADAGQTHHGQAPKHLPVATGGEAASPWMRLLPLISPLNWFSWFIGAGATGLACRGFLSEPVTAAAAVGGALVFNWGVVKPVWRFVFSWASEPSKGLEGCVLQSVEAVTGFNERGEGLVRVLIDGRSEDVLARLSDQELKQGLRVRRGDRLLIEEVDPETDSVRVYRA